VFGAGPVTAPSIEGRDPLSVHRSPSRGNQPDTRGDVDARYDRIDTDGKLTLRHDGHLHHIGRTHARTPIIRLIHNLQIHIVNALTGELLRDLTLDTTRDYPPQKPKTPRTRGFGVPPMS
jgi:hypothetical protein